MVIACAFGAWRSWQHRQLEQRPGILVRGEPQQDSLGGADSRAFEHEGFTLKPQASYRIQARLLGRESYGNGRESELSQLDFALGWGPMSDSTVLDAIEISQSGRFFWVRWPDQPPIPENEIFVHAANTHLIPADRRVSDMLDKMRPGQLIELSGRLVNASAADGWHWNSSLKRTDTGAGACELMWVEDARILN